MVKKIGIEETLVLARKNLSSTDYKTYLKDIAFKAFEHAIEYSNWSIKNLNKYTHSTNINKTYIWEKLIAKYDTRFAEYGMESINRRAYEL